MSLKCMVTVFFVLMLPIMLSCSGGGDSATEPSTTTITMSGNVELPESSNFDTAELTIGMGNHDESIAEDGSFTLQGNEHLPGLAMVQDADGTPVLMSVVPDPSNGHEFSVDARSTAVALAFLHPFICTSNSDYIESTLTELEALPEFDELEDVIEQQLVESTLALGVTDADLDSALARVVRAYINSQPATVAGKATLLKNRTPFTPGQEQDDGMQIDPDWEVSGHRLTWKGGSTFEISNSYGRWAYCTTPSESFFVFPNGDFLDIIKGSRPWSPSQKEFSMTIEPNADSQFVRLYGYGFAPWRDYEWDDLTPEEQMLAHSGGMATVMIELCSQMLAVITNTSSIYGKGDIANKLGNTVLSLLLTDVVLMQQIAAYIDTDDPWGLSWHLTKHIMNELVTNPSFRSAFAAATGVALTGGTIAKLASWLAVPAKAVMVYNSVTSVLKTAMGFSTADFKTEFAVWRNVEDYGAVRGQVADAENGRALEDATVTLTGDENNPLNPNHVVTTGTDGYYRFDNIGVGAKTITAVRTGYTTRTISVVIEKDTEITEHITMHKERGGVGGRILNGILVHHGIDPATFAETVELEIYPTDGSDDTRYLYVYSGQYSLNLPTGSWWVKADYDDYLPDSMIVSVQSEGTESAPRDLVLEPSPKAEGRIYIDMNNDGSYELDYYVEFPIVGLAAPKPNACPLGGSGTSIMEASAIKGNTYSTYDFVYFGFDVLAVTGAGVLPVGGLMNFSCGTNGTSGVVWLVTNRRYCSGELGSTTMSFGLVGDTQTPACDCGISQPGNFYLTDWSTELAGLVAGGVTVDLPGWANCFCSQGDEDGDGIDDAAEVECAKAKLDIDFRLLVGTRYLVEAGATAWPPRPGP